MNLFKRGDRVRVIDDLGNSDLWLYARREVGKVELLSWGTKKRLVLVRWIWTDEGGEHDFECWVEPRQLEKAA